MRRVEFTELSHVSRSVRRAATASPPISMRTLAALLTLAPFALAIAIISGLLLQFPLVLLAMPVLIGLTLPRQARAAIGPVAHAI